MKKWSQVRFTIHELMREHFPVELFDCEKTINLIGEDKYLKFVQELVEYKTKACLTRGSLFAWSPDQFLLNYKEYNESLFIYPVEVYLFKQVSHK